MEVNLYEYIGCREKRERKKRQFKEVHLDSLAVGEKSMVCKINYQNGDFASEHSHSQEQCGYVISGEYELTIREKK